MKLTLFPLLLLLATTVSAVVPDQHLDCSRCHFDEIQPSAVKSTWTGNANLCLGCHTAGGIASAAAIGGDTAADPWEAHTGSSHAWAVSPENPLADSQMPGIPALADNLEEGLVICTTCHNPHSESAGKPLLNASNAADALCFDCHRARMLGPWRDDPEANIGSHPVGVPVPADPELFRSPASGDADIPLLQGNVSCSSCHRVHQASSTTSFAWTLATNNTDGLSALIQGATFTADMFEGWRAEFSGSGLDNTIRRTISSNSTDTFFWRMPLGQTLPAGTRVALHQTGDGDGNLLRTANDETLCTTCHLFPLHPPHEGGNPCFECHQVHGSTNPLLVRDEIAGRALVFDGLLPGDFVHGPPDYDGVCETCHTNTAYHRNNASGAHDHNTGSVCIDCHDHKNGFLPEACGSCHAATPETLDTGSHKAHFLESFGPHITECDTCHGAGAAQGTHAGHQNGTPNFAGGADETLDQTAVCNECHSPGGFENGVQLARAAWPLGVYDPPGVLLPEYQRWCFACHDDDPDTPASESALIDGQSALPISGNNVTTGFYVTGHGRSGQAFPAMSWQAPGALGNPASDINCDTCHDPALPHIGDRTGNESRFQPGYEVDQANTGCSQCHQPSGPAAGMPDYYQYSGPFEQSAHAGYLCTECHNPHGLAGPFPAMSVADEEGLCYECHDTVQQDFMKSSHHDVTDADHQQNGSRLECTMCHNPHLGGGQAASRLVDPNAPDMLWSGNTKGFCLTCHDGDSPAAVQFPAQFDGTGWDKSDFEGTRHDVVLGGDCTLCHQQHGTSFPALLTGTYSMTDNVSYSAANYQACFQCHDTADVMSNRNAFSREHDRHVRDERASCIICHNAHKSYDAGETGLIDFGWVDNSNISFSLQSGGTLSSSFVDTGTDRGSCDLRCHGENHNPETYSGTANVTVDCLLCHAANP